MSRKILVVEPDGPGRAMMDRVLTAAGFSAEGVASIHDARALLDGGKLELAVVDELAGTRAVLEEVRRLRRDYPALPVVVIGALLSQRVMQELVRLQVADVLSKPFTPDELRDAVTRVVSHRTARRADALEYAAAVTAARRAIAAGSVAEARPPLSRAQATSPFDAEIMALWALAAELDGHDDDAGRGYRAALALRHDEDTPPPDPHEGLARLDAYAGARPAPSLRPERAGAPLWLVADPARELALGAPSGEGPHVVVMALGLGGDGPGALFFRDGDGPRAFALLSGALRAESAAAALARLGRGPIVAAEATRSRLDVARIEALRAESYALPAES